MKIEIVARESIKPSSPTPKSFNISFMDQLSHPVYNKLYFFYQNTSTDDIKLVVAERSRCLKSSLSQVLSLYPPIAGKNRDQMTVSLEEDDGAEFLEGRVDSNLTEFLEKPFPEMFMHLAPDDFWETIRRPQLIVQANFFKCGGLAIGVNISHKVSDTCTFTSFINVWAKTAFGKSDNIINPDFSASLAFPAVEKLFVSGEYLKGICKVNNKTKRFVFTASKLATLQKKFANETMNRATRIEAVTVFMWRIGMKTSIEKAGGSPVTSSLIMPVNIRKWQQPPICEQSFGNLVEFQIVWNDNCDIELPYLLSLLREQMKKSSKAHEKKLDGQQFLERCVGINKKMTELIAQPDVKNNFTISSWSKFPLYDADFGWGKPTWVAMHNILPYVMYLMDTRDGTGIKAWVNFPEEDMSIFASDEELLTYAILDPSALETSKLD